MKTVAGLIGWLIFIGYVILGILYFTSIWGGIGFFGSLITIPMSTIVYVILASFGSVTTFVINLVAVAIMAICFSYGNE